MNNATLSQIIAIIEDDLAALMAEFTPLYQAEIYALSDYQQQLHNRKHGMYMAYSSLLMKLKKQLGD